MANPVTWFEVLGPDGTALQDFYRELFGWPIDADNPMSYGIVPAGDGGIGGGVAASPDGTAQVSFYVQVDDLQATLDRARQLGGQIVAGPREVPEGPTLAYFTDPAGNRIGLLKQR